MQCALCKLVFLSKNSSSRDQSAFKTHDLNPWLHLNKNKQLSLFLIRLIKTGMQNRIHGATKRIRGVSIYYPRIFCRHISFNGAVISRVLILNVEMFLIGWMSFVFFYVFDNVIMPLWSKYYIYEVSLIFRWKIMCWFFITHRTLVTILFPRAIKFVEEINEAEIIKITHPDMQ